VATSHRERECPIDPSATRLRSIRSPRAASEFPMRSIQFAGARRVRVRQGGGLHERDGGSRRCRHRASQIVFLHGPRTPGEPVVTISDHVPGGLAAGLVGECSPKSCNYRFEGQRRARSWSRMRIPSNS